jgi:hypothetical protein
MFKRSRVRYSDWGLGGSLVLPANSEVEHVIRHYIHRVYDTAPWNEHRNKQTNKPCGRRIGTKRWQTSNVISIALVYVCDVHVELRWRLVWAWAVAGHLLTHKERHEDMGKQLNVMRHYKKKRWPNKMAVTCVKVGRTANCKHPFQI